MTILCNTAPDEDCAVDIAVAFSSSPKNRDRVIMLGRLNNMSGLTDYIVETAFDAKRQEQLDNYTGDYKLIGVFCNGKGLQL